MGRSPRDILADNLRRLRDARPHLDTLPKIAAAGGPSNGTLDRIQRRAAGASIDTLERLAAVFELEPWQLLIDGLEPNNPPLVRGTSAAERKVWHRIHSLVRELGDLREQPHSRPQDLSDK